MYQKNLMAYRTFTAKQIHEILGLTIQRLALFQNMTVPTVTPSARLQLVLETSLKMAITTEKAVSEYLVSPILTDIKINNPSIELFSGEQLNVDKERNLNGEIDFLFTRTPNFLAIEAPVFSITEAKIGLIDKAIPQAAAQMYGARLFNEMEGYPLEIVYGAVTDGKTWRFLKLQNQILFIDENILYLDNLPLLLGTLQYIVDFYN